MSEVTTIEVTTPEQLETVLRINEEVQKAHFGNVLRPGQIEYMIDTLWTREKFQSAMDDLGERFFLFNQGSESVGFYSYVPRGVLPKSDPEEFGIKLSHIFLRESARGHGLFTQALDHIKRVGRETKEPCIFLAVNRKNNAVDIYKGKGFVVTAEIDIDIGNGFIMDDCVMKYDL